MRDEKSLTGLYVYMYVRDVAFIWGQRTHTHRAHTKDGCLGGPIPLTRAFAIHLANYYRRAPAMLKTLLNISPSERERETRNRAASKRVRNAKYARVFRYIQMRLSHFFSHPQFHFRL